MKSFSGTTPDLPLNDEHLMSLDDFLEKFEYLAQTVEAVDRSPLVKIPARFI